MPVLDHYYRLGAGRSTRSSIYDFLMGLVDDVVMHDATYFDYDTWRKMTALFEEAIEEQCGVCPWSLELHQRRVPTHVLTLRG